MKRIPVLVVSGFLGSGKTTLVKRLLADAQLEGARVAFISNEMNELGVDAALLGGGGEAVVELAGGCVCCALNDALYDTLIKLKETVDPDRIVIECSGAAVPHDVQITLYQPPVRDWVSEEAVVVVVNAEQVAEGRDLEGLFAEQIESADIALLNRTDGVDPAQIPALREAVAALNPGLPVLETIRCDVDPRLLLGRLARRDAPHDRDHDHAGHAHLHLALDTEVRSFPPGLPILDVEAQLSATGALRIKGFVQAAEGLYVVQGVGRRLESVPAEEPPPADLVGKVVVIRRAGGARPG